MGVSSFWGKHNKSTGWITPEMPKPNPNVRPICCSNSDFLSSHGNIRRLTVSVVVGWVHFKRLGQFLFFGLAAVRTTRVRNGPARGFRNCFRYVGAYPSPPQSIARWIESQYLGQMISLLSQKQSRYLWDYLWFRLKILLYFDILTLRLIGIYHILELVRRLVYLIHDRKASNSCLILE